METTKQEMPAEDLNRLCPDYHLYQSLSYESIDHSLICHSRYFTQLFISFHSTIFIFIFLIVENQLLVTAASETTYLTTI